MGSRRDLHRRPLPRPALSREALVLIAARFRALSDVSRLAILDALMSGDLSVSELMQRTGLTQTTVSRQLGVLRRAQIVAGEPDGRRVVYRIVDPAVEKVCHVVCGGLETQLARALQSMPSRSRVQRRVS